MTRVRSCSNAARISGICKSQNAHSEVNIDGLSIYHAGYISECAFWDLQNRPVVGSLSPQSMSRERLL